MKDIVERLRRDKNHLERDREDAANEIERLRRRVAELDLAYDGMFDEIERLRETAYKKHNAYAYDVSRLLSELRKTEWLIQPESQDESI